MIVHTDQINMIPLDEFTSLSGLWHCVLAQRFEASEGANAYYMVTYYAGTNRVRYIHQFSIDDELLAYQKWEDWRRLFGAPTPDAVYEDEAPPAATPIKMSPPYPIPEDETVLKMRPQGDHIFIRDITPVDEITARAQAVGIVAIVNEENKPRPTCGMVLKVGPDPLAQELYKEGDIVMFSRHAGHTFNEAGQTYRAIQLHEIIGSRDPKEGVEDLIWPTLPPGTRPGDVIETDEIK